jgi:hypothetical protein
VAWCSGLGSLLALLAYEPRTSQPDNDAAHCPDPDNWHEHRVIIAGGKLSSIPMVRPVSHPEHGMSIRDDHKTDGESVEECPGSATRLSGKDIGSIDSTVSAPITDRKDLPKRTATFFPVWNVYA